MPRRFLPALLIVLSFAPTVFADNNWQAREDWSAHFTEYDATGTIVVLDERGESPEMWVYNRTRAETPYPPASTYKVPHALFALVAGVVHDEFQVFKWDGIQRQYEPWNRDQNLRSSMRHSVVWVYEQFARELGEVRAREYLNQAGYGNADPSGGDGLYWIDGNLRITALEQVVFLRRLFRNELPFSVEYQRLVKDIMIVEAGRAYILRAKTGWQGQTGWWVGWVEHPTGAVFFALNIDTPKRSDDLYKREAITRAILREIDALPGE